MSAGAASLGAGQAPGALSQDRPFGAHRRVLLLCPGSPSGFGAELCDASTSYMPGIFRQVEGQRMWEPSAGVKRDASCNGWARMSSKPLSLDAPGRAYFHATMS